MNEICTCTKAKCPLHPFNHDKGCTPCIGKNLKLREVPNCFFQLVTDDIDSIKDSSLKGFAAEVLDQKSDEH